MKLPQIIVISLTVGVVAGIVSYRERQEQSTGAEAMPKMLYPENPHGYSSRGSPFPFPDKPTVLHVDAPGDRDNPMSQSCIPNLNVMCLAGKFAGFGPSQLAGGSDWRTAQSSGITILPAQAFGVGTSYILDGETRFVTVTPNARGFADKIEYDHSYPVEKIIKLLLDREAHAWSISSRGRIPSPWDDRARYEDGDPVGKAKFEK